jgi:hypothetical protein
MSIHATDRKFTLYWSNHLAQIHGNSESWEWRYVPSEFNPADVGSRGSLSNCFSEDMSVWVSGPNFLYESQQKWPISPEVPQVEEVCAVSDICALTSHNQCELLSHVIGYYSSLSKLLRIIARLIRFMRNCQSKNVQSQVDYAVDVQLSDLRDAKVQLIKHEQQTLKLLNFKKFKCFRDDSGMLRVQGRITDSALSYDTRFPILLPQNSHLTKLIVLDEHKMSCHMGTNHVLYQLRLKYWIVDGRHTVKKYTADCHICRKKNAQRLSQEMSPLPLERVKSAHPFQFVGVDYFGPIVCKSRRSRVKRYGCIFVCLSTRAVHLECAASLETVSFLAAFSRFMARRGVPDKMYSDNATNLRGGQDELRKFFEAKQNEVDAYMMSKNVQWHFHPPHGSHHGGHYKRLIPSVRSVLFSVCVEHEMSEDNLVTFLCEAERVLNDRPITTLTDDNSHIPLSPSMILLLRDNSCAPLFPSDDDPRRFHKQAQYLADIFWRRFLKEYVSTLVLRQK